MTKRRRIELQPPALRTFAGSQPPEIPGQLRFDQC